MLDLFRDTPIINKGVVQIPQFVYVRGSYNREIAKVVEYYQNNVKWIANQHPLIRLMLSLNVSMKRDYQNYVDVISDATMRIAGPFRFTTATNHGALFTNGDFYNRNVVEVVIINDDEFDIQAAIDGWRELQPIRVLRHPFTDLSLGRCDGNYTWSDEQGIAVISVNICMLAFQYRRWCEEEAVSDISGNREAIHQFFSRYPITNMIYSHVDVCYFNRLTATYRNEPVAAYIKAHPFFVVDYSAKVDDVIQKQLAIEEGRQLTFDHMLISIAEISTRNLFEAMALPNVVLTRQVKWALIIARLPLIRFLVRFNQLSGNAKNTFYIAKLRIAIREIRNDHLLHGSLPEWLQDELELTLEEIVSYL